MLRTSSHCPEKSFRNRVERSSAGCWRTCCARTSGQHPADLLRQDVRLAQLLALSQLQEIVVRDALPQEEGQPRRELQIAQAVDAARRIRAIFLDAQHELRRGEQRLEGAGDARVEGPAGAPLGIDRHQLVDVGFGAVAAIGAPRQVEQDPPRARVFLPGVRGLTGENLPPHRCVWRRAGIERP
jgi:hypothetical protein